MKLIYKNLSFVHSVIIPLILSVDLSYSIGNNNNGVKSKTPTTPRSTDQPPPLRVKLTTEQKWIQTSLERHNYYRSLHGSDPLALNNTLSEISQSWANHLLERALESLNRTNTIDFFDHNKAVNKKYGLGENLAYRIFYSKLNGSWAVNEWYNEIKDYDFRLAKVKATSKQDSMIGHLTQLIWKASKQMGTAYAARRLSNDQTMTFVVASYYPGGNLYLSGDSPMKFYFENVLPPMSDAENEVEDNANVIHEKILYWKVPKTALTTPRSWIEIAAEKHNEFRRIYNVPELSVNDELCEVAQGWADKLLRQGLSNFNTNFMIDLRSNPRNIYATEKARFGENLMYFISDGLVDPEYVVSLWFKEKEFYNFEARKTNITKSKTARTNHFEQIIWKSTTHMGIAFSSGQAENGQILTFAVANYYPSGQRYDKSFEEKIANIPDNGAPKTSWSSSFLSLANLVVLHLSIRLLFYDNK